ncbi:MAG: glutathione S-transferase family protein [Oceanococcaceae bacterium]
MANPSELILHHYAFSPFSEKVRLMLGYTGVPWRSVIVAPMPPRPALAQLAGGYRKVPVLQIGADIFCDSHEIAAELARRSGRSELDLTTLPEDAQALARFADLQGFLACLVSSNTAALRRRVHAALGWRGIARFLWDRIKIGQRARVPDFRPAQARAVRDAFLADLSQRLNASPFLFGTAPNHADFSAYHGLWFARDLAELPALRQYPAVLAWMDRMRAFGHGNAEPLTSADALDVARAHAPAPLPAALRGSGAAVRIAPTDYARDPTTGTVAGETEHAWILAADDAELGRLHRHFPREGYALRAVDS